jgi:hypothetical protein
MKKIKQTIPLGWRTVEFKAEVLDERRSYGRDEILIDSMEFTKPIWIKKGDQSANNGAVC